MNALKKTPSKNYNIHVEIRGREDAPGLLFLHGFLGSSQDWSGFMEVFGQDFFCVALDLPGHGRSLEENNWIYSMPHIAEHIAELLQAWPAKKWSVVGYSMGGRLALYLAVHYAHIFAKAVVISASPGLENEVERQEREHQDELLTQVLLQNPLSEFLKHWYQQPLFSSLSQKPWFKEVGHRRLQNEPKYLAKSMQLMGLAKQPSLWKMLGGCFVHLQFVCGVWDEKFVALNQKMYRLCPQANMKVIANCGHNVVLDAPQELIQIIRLFLS